jgi:protein-tyrosine phosphatase
MRVLFVCTGNICRSPTAELLTAAYARESGAADLSAHSAGTRALVDHGVESSAAQVLRRLGGDPDGFRARRLTPAIAQDADLVLTMTEQHRSAVLTMAPRMLRTTFTLREAARLQQASGASTVAELADARARHDVPVPAGPEDIDDPIGRDDETFARVASEIADLLVPVLRRVRG